jgi:hypothetical protein
MWVLLVCIALPFCLFVAAILAAFAFGVWRSVLTGQPMPDLLGGIDRLPWHIIGPALGGLFAAYLARGRQIVREMEVGGGQDRRPFDPYHTPGTPSEPSPTGGLVNNGALDQQ